MAEHPQYLSEKLELDQCLNKGFLIYDIRDHLNGTDVLLKKTETDETMIVHLGNANARKYATTMLTLQMASERRAT
ncbi:hypothetical protein [Alkalicoccobacillus murimartini]|uniref:Uncharacterized protein n=1 Tax=Alkalicoccobacillus murimartini TaxID=171685 RepID=A0ABT9YHD0_9BACI|nr:hypothetical protein [Alkalicoccobacillus murimartini]MDQ0207277.1 hypothetical protein [Alkalicoccobacillus murimartini]